MEPFIGGLFKVLIAIVEIIYLTASDAQSGKAPAYPNNPYYMRNIISIKNNY